MCHVAYNIQRFYAVRRTAATRVSHSPAGAPSTFVSGCLIISSSPISSILAAAAMLVVAPRSRGLLCFTPTLFWSTLVKQERVSFTLVQGRKAAGYETLNAQLILMDNGRTLHVSVIAMVGCWLIESFGLRRGVETCDLCSGIYDYVL